MIGAIVLAAGSSTRMGSQKLLLPYGGIPLIRHVVESVQRGPIEVTIVVTGYSREGVEGALAGLDVRFVHNADHQTGMLSSVRSGIRALPIEFAPMVVLGDQPVVPQTVLDQIRQTLDAQPDRIVVPVHSGRRGHPMAFSACFRDEVLTEFDDVGLRGLLQKHVGAVVEFEVNAPEILVDLDTPDDYAAALSQLQKGAGGSKT